MGIVIKLLKKINTYSDNKRVRAKPKSLLGQGKLKSLVLKTLRTSSDLLKTDDLALEVIETKEFELTDEIVSKDTLNCINISY